jgi:hypothetical protein
MRQHGFPVLGDRVLDERHRPDGALDRIQQGQAREDAHDELLLGRGEGPQA